MYPFDTVSMQSKLVANETNSSPENHHNYHESLHEWNLHATGYHIYSLLRLFLHLGAPTISEVSLALFRSVGWRELDSANVAPAVRQNTGSGARTGFWQTPLLGRTLLRALLCWVSGITLPLSAEYAVNLFAFSLQVGDSAGLGEVQLAWFEDIFW